MKLGCRDLLNRMQRSIWKSMNQLNQLDRKHPFWQNTNRRPDLSKLERFNHMRLYENSDDEDALWAQASMLLYLGFDFDKMYWARLWSLGNLDIRYPILAALDSEMFVGIARVSDPEKELRELSLGTIGLNLVDLLFEIKATKEAIPKLEELINSSSLSISCWAHKVAIFCIFASPTEEGGYCFMLPESQFGSALGITHQWEADLRFTKTVMHLELKIEYKHDIPFPCPVCGSPATVHDAIWKTWANPKFYHYEASLIAHVPRVMCPNAGCGINPVSVPWSSADSGFTPLP